MLYGPSEDHTGPRRSGWLLDAEPHQEAIGTRCARVARGAPTGTPETCAPRRHQFVGLHIALGIEATGTGNVDAGGDAAAATAPTATMSPISAVASTTPRFRAEYLGGQAPIGTLASESTDPAGATCAPAPAHTTPNAIVGELGQLGPPPGPKAMSTAKEPPPSGL